jgi:hypothetical protein
MVLPPPLALYDDRSQRVAGANQWTNVAFNTQLFTSSAWIREPGSSSIRCNRTALYHVYFGIQAQLNNTVAPADTPFACVPCHMRYMIRAIQERAADDDDTSILLEVPGSLSYCNGETLFHAKMFYIDAQIDDVVQFQFLSTCPSFTLHPMPYIQSPNTMTPVSETFSSSTVLLIS